MNNIDNAMQGARISDLRKGVLGDATQIPATRSLAEAGYNEARPRSFIPEPAAMGAVRPAGGAAPAGVPPTDTGLRGAWGKLTAPAAGGEFYDMKLPSAETVNKVGRGLNAATKLPLRVVGTMGKYAQPLVEAGKTAAVIADPASTGADMGEQAAAGIGRTGATIAGMGLGANTGMMLGTLGGPAAPVTVPLGGLVGGVIGGGLGYWGADKAIDAGKSIGGNLPTTSPAQRTAKRMGMTGEFLTGEPAPSAVPVTPKIAAVSSAIPNALSGAPQAFKTPNELNVESGYDQQHGNTVAPYVRPDQKTLDTTMVDGGHGRSIPSYGGVTGDAMRAAAIAGTHADGTPNGGPKLSPADYQAQQDGFRAQAFKNVGLVEGQPQQRYAPGSFGYLFQNAARRNDNADIQRGNDTNSRFAAAKMQTDASVYGHQLSAAGTQARLMHDNQKEAADELDNIATVYQKDDPSKIDGPATQLARAAARRATDAKYEVVTDPKTGAKTRGKMIAPAYVDAPPSLRQATRGDMTQALALQRNSNAVGDPSADIPHYVGEDTVGLGDLFGRNTPGFWGTVGAKLNPGSPNKVYIDQHGRRRTESQLTVDPSGTVMDPSLRELVAKQVSASRGR